MEDSPSSAPRPEKHSHQPENYSPQSHTDKKAAAQYSRQSSFQKHGLLSQAVQPGGVSRRSSAILGSVYGVPGRSHHRKYRSRAGSVTGSAAEWSLQLDQEDNGSSVTRRPSFTTRPSEIPELDEDRNLLGSAEQSARLKNHRSLPSFADTRKSLLAMIHTCKTTVFGALVTGVKTLRWEKKTAILASKVGVTCCLASLLIISDELRRRFQGFGVWAVITAALVYEANIGTSLNKGFNRIMGTLIAGCVAFGVNHVGPMLGAYEPYFVLMSVFTTTWIPVYLRFSSPLKDQWNYACSMATITAHLLILGGYKQAEERFNMPLARFLTIVGGFVLATVVNLAVKPNFAGDNLHALVSKNFKTAADVVEKCVEEYVKGTELDPVAEILTGKKIEDQLHSLYRGIVMSESDVDKMMGVISWEPRHGKFTGRYPWALYSDVTDNLRYTVYVIISLDSCLRAEIQAPKALRDVFSQELTSVGKEIGNVLRLLHRSLKDMRRFPLHEAFQQAELAALRLQMRLYDNAQRLLMEGDKPPTAVDVGVTLKGGGGFYRDDEGESEIGVHDGKCPDRSPGACTKSRQGSPEKTAQGFTGSRQNSPRSTGNGLNGDRVAKEAGKSEPIGTADLPVRRSSWLPSGQEEPGTTNGEDEEDHPVCGSSRESDDGSQSDLKQLLEPLKAPVRERTGRDRRESARGTWPREPSPAEYRIWEAHYDSTLERVCAMSLVKFASTLIECVAGLRFLVESVDALAERAGFDDPEKGHGE